MVQRRRNTLKSISHRGAGAGLAAGNSSAIDRRRSGRISAVSRVSLLLRVEAVEKRLRRAGERYERSNKGILAAVENVVRLWLIVRELERLSARNPGFKGGPASPWRTRRA